MNKSDIIIIGSGPGGYRAAEHAARNGLAVTIFECSHAGGTCLNSGCIPTKTLCRNAEILETMRHAGAFGLDNLSFSLNFDTIMQRKRQVVSTLREGVESLMQLPGITMVHAKASFKDSNTVVADGQEYTAPNIIIATGSLPKLPPIEGIQLPGVLDSTQMLDITHIPGRLCIIGAGVIGMEMASVFSSLGSKVTVVEFLKECLPTLDSDVAKRLRQAIAKRGVEFAMQSAVRSIRDNGVADGEQQLCVEYEKKGKMYETCADVVLVATGRRPNTDGLQLHNAGIEHTPKGIVTDDNFRTSVQGIYAIGDVNGKCMLAHAATSQGLHVVNSILGREDDILFDVMPSAIFTLPEAASVGPSEDQLKAEGKAYQCRKGFYRANGKALAMGETDGLVKLIVSDDHEGRIIACHAFGAHAADMIQEVAALINRQATLSQLADIIHIHPTLSEIIHDMSM